MHFTDIVFWSSAMLALGGGSHAGPEASKANTEFIFVFISLLVIIACIYRLKK